MASSKPAYRDLTDGEEAAIQAEILADPDHPELTDAQIATGRPFAEVFPDLAESIRRTEAERGASRERVSLDLDGDVLAKFRATGEGWEERINEVLRSAKP
ncbi:BrnA antitoxin family protein [Rhizobium sp. DKSPLA3]|uniref:BrnA antitoxin family protein n=1 Tax=Rhizobium quercicola TaxID=2901226 RepID=A0A9X1T227_9HYPH|nr:BrnA antitoxin family protein [Rhizobium quercicola]MCD7110530.1 BrnA antitoxin family protein [Rhizobium quercicola]